MDIIWYPSQNWNTRPFGIKPNFIIIHYTACDLDTALTILSQPSDYPVSAHYVIAENGQIYHLVPDTLRAWHAGRSWWKNYENLNDYSLGIELVHSGDSSIAYPDQQMESLALLCQRKMQEFHIPLEHILGHSDIAPDRKQDPGEHFNWKWLRHQLIQV